MSNEPTHRATLDLQLDDLNEELAEVARIIGLELTAKIVEECGGWRVYVPVKPTEDCALSRVIGPEAARRLSEALGKGTLWVPRLDAVYRRQRDAQIRARLAAGATAREVALTFGISVRHVFKIKNGA